MKNNFKKLLLISAGIVFFSVGLFFAQSALAAPIDLGLQPLDATGLGHVDIRIIVANIIKSALGLLGILAVVLMLYAGYEWMASGGNEEQIGTAKKILINATIGLAIILSAYSIVAFVMTKLVEATGFNGGVNPECKAQIDKGGANCGGKCPSCGDCPVGVDCSAGESFHINQKPSGGNVCVANYYPIMVFNKDVDIDSLNHLGAGGHPDNIQVINTLTNGVVDGTWNYQGGNNREVYFSPPTKCSDNKNYYCFEYKTPYKIVIAKSANIKTKSGLQSLSCSGAYNCSNVSFTSGDKIDSTPPQITVKFPQPGDSFSQGNTIGVIVDYKDDVGLQTLNLIADNNFITSVQPQNNCDTSGTLTVNWNTLKAALGSHNIGLIGIDWGNNQIKTNFSINLKPTHCYDNKLDESVGEKFSFPSPAGDCGGECGSCAGDICTQNSNCSSGYCEKAPGAATGVCVNKVRVDYFSLDNGAAGDYVSVFGKYFGKNPGHVYFASSTSGKWVEAMPVNCGANFKYWTDNQIVVSVPPSIAAAGPLKVVTEVGGTNGTDVTNDSWGASSVFTLTNTSHPGICTINPTAGFEGQPFSVSGKGFGKLADLNVVNDGIFFQGSKVKIGSWDENLISSFVPVGLGNGDFTVQAKKGGLYSNGVKFSISGSNPNGPIITALSTTSTARGDYLVIYGKNFGAQGGSVIFNKDGNAGNPNIVGSVDFPQECKKFNSIWNDGQVMVKIPNTIDLNSDFSVRIKLADNITFSPINNNFSIRTVSGDAKPGICAINPPSGPVPFVGNVLNIYGDNLENIDVAYFWKIGASSSVLSSLEASVVTLDTNHHITTKPGGGVASGPMFVTTLGTKKSNSVQFSVFNCTKNNNTCADAVNDQCCVVGQQNGMCIPKSETCIGAKRNAGYVWLFSTGGISSIPQVVERCDATTEAGNFIPSPAPSTLWNTGGSVDASNVCQTAVATVEFTATLDQATVNANTVKIFTCSSINGNKCVDQKPIDNAQINQKSYELKVSNSNSNNTPHHYLEISLKDNQKWTPNTWYQVVLNSGIKSLVSKNKYNENIQFDLASSKPCGDGTAYCFSFRTGQGDCKLKQVIVTPSQFWTSVLEEPIRYHTVGGDAYDITYSGNGLSTQRCIMMNVNGFAWTWSPAVTQYVKRLSTFGPSNRLAQFGSEANTVGIGLPNNSVYINATAATTTNGVVTSKTGTSSLIIDLSDPKVMDYEPKCLEACTDALVSATFNVSMSNKNLTTAVKLYKCNDENCLSTQPVGGLTAEIDPASGNGRRWLKIFNNVQGQILLPDTLYKVVLSASSTPDINSGSQLWSLAKANDPVSFSKPVSQEFSWRFHTKKEACAIDRVDVSPKIFTAQKLDDRAVFVAQPYSAPDACSVSGQKLNPFKYTWNWASSDLQVASIKSFTTKGHNPYCTNNCLLTGSNIPSGSAAATYPVCGNNVLEAGEDCLAPNKLANCSLNCLTIGKTKKGSQINTDSKDVNASICGNGMLGVDEDCDLGIAPLATATTSAMFCNANCLHSGTPLSSAWCKDHKVDKGGFSTDEFNQACLGAFSRCGDGVVDYNEDPGCDIGGGKYDNSCNDRCLKLVRCVAGEIGCNDGGQKQGSSLMYPEPSACGDGAVGAGEDAQCDDVTNFVGPIKTLVDPWVLAIGQGGGQPSGVPPVQFSNITGTTNNKPGVGKYQVECGWKTDSECAGKYNDPNRGVGDDSCCYARPQLTKVYPGSTSAQINNICINTYIEAHFDSVIDINTLAGNLLLAKYNEVGNTCATGTEMVSDSLIAGLNNYSNLAWYQKAFNKIVIFVKNIFGNKYAQASVWCAGSDLATPAVVPDGNGGSKVILQLNQALSVNTTYAVVLKTGIKDIKGVSIRNGAGGKPLGWKFKTGGSICEVSSVTISPDHYAFNTANASTTLVAEARTQNNQIIVPVPGYVWNYSWGPKVNDFVTLSNTSSSINNIISQNRNGELDVYASANIVDNKFTKQTGLVGTGRSRIIVFLCENPWPPLKQMVGTNGPFTIFPYEDKVGNNDNFNLAQNIFDNTAIPASEVVSAGYFNFSTYYCADSGVSGSKTDDLPYLKPAVQIASTTLGSGSFVTSSAEISQTVPDKSTCANDSKIDCAVDADCTNYTLSIYGSKQIFITGNTGMCVPGTQNTSNYYFDTNNKPVTCNVVQDCLDALATNQPFSNFYNNLGPDKTMKCNGLNNYSPVKILSTCVAHTKVVTSTIQQSLAKPFNALKRFFFTSTKNSDAIGIQILSNPNHLTARQWFELDKKLGGQGFQSSGSLQDVSVDGYDAVSDGNNIYVNALNFTASAANVNSGNLYTNTYLFSINPNAGDETRKVFGQFVKNLKFNLNLTNDKRCVVPGNGPVADAPACESDFDCVATATTTPVCSAQKNKLQRDFKRLQDTGKIFNALNNYNKNHGGTYPDLKAGTYLTGQTVSTWPSWSVLANAVSSPGNSLPVDPINKLGVSGTCASSTGVFCVKDSDCSTQIPADQKCILHDPTTGWSTESQRFSFACAPNSLAYRYMATSTSSTIPGANNYVVKMNWEIIGLGQGLNILNKVSLFDDFVPSGDASKFNSDSGICNQSKEISSLVVGTCGDGKVGKNEACDPPGGVKWNLSECSVQGATGNTVLHGDICSKSCQWQTSATSTSCGAKLATCKNGIVEVGEACDEGALNGQYGHCNATCTGFSSTCGDGEVSSTFEVCDTKASYSGWCIAGYYTNNICADDSSCNSSGSSPFSSTNGKCVTLGSNNNKYGLTQTVSCASDCQKYGPYCGDGMIQPEFGEECDGNQICSIDNAPGNRVCNNNCRWKNNSAIVYYKFDDVWTSNLANIPSGKSYIPNSGSGTGINVDFMAYCAGDASQGCPAVAPSVDIKRKQAMYFNGDKNYFTINPQKNFNLNELTFSAWINVDPSISDGYHTIISKENDKAGDGRDYDHNRDYNLYLIKTTSGTEKFVSKLHLSSRVFPDNYSNTNSSSVAIFGSNELDLKIPTNEWHFIAVTVDALRNTKYYLDGNLAGMGATNGSTTIKADHNYPIKIGRDDSSYFKGSMDELQLYGRALTGGEIKDLYLNSSNFCELSSVPKEVAVVAGSCGNSKVEADNGEVCDKGSENGKACTSSYNQSCTYCSFDCKNVITVNANGFCGDSIINGSEKCEMDSIGSLISFATSSGTGDDFLLSKGLSTFNQTYTNHGGYKVLQCYDEFNTTLNASSSYWYNQFLAGDPNAKNNLIGKIGDKSCAANCGIGSGSPVISSCVACGLSEKGSVISGAIVNVLDPKGKNPLIAEPASIIPPKGHLGYMDLLYPKKDSAITGNINAYKVAFDLYGFGSQITSYKFQTDSSSGKVDAKIESNPVCSDVAQDRYYRLALNADWSKEHLIDFPVFSTAQPDTYNLILSPVIPKNNVNSTVNTVARPNDIRVVVSWVGKDVAQFSAGFLGSDFVPSKWVPSETNITPNVAYYLDNDKVWFHGFGSIPEFNLNEEAFTLDTTRMGASSYAFFVQVSSSSAAISQIGKDAKLKVDIYAAEPQRAQENNDVYRHFARPIKTFYFSQAMPSSNSGAQYWHVFNIIKESSPVAEYANHFYVGSNLPKDKQYNSVRTDVKLVY